MFQLGPFELHEPLGKGGSGVVWGGLHPETRLAVAVKVLTAEVARDPTWRAAFRHEVRAVAALAHPGVVQVHDHGVVDEQAAVASGFELPLGSPWLAMTRIEGGTLSSSPPTSWHETRAVLLGLLDALAHAHARAVIHRDLKPGNVLMGPSGPILTDFGLAHPLGHRVELPAPVLSAGTPGYMAPEQFDVRWRDYGPWTDLYALGCVAWRLVTRELPFPLRGFAAAGRAHRTQPPPAFQPAFPVPDGLEDWLRRLLAKAPVDRYARAADAAWSLTELTEPVQDRVPSHIPSLPTPTTLHSAPAAAAEAAPPPMPRDWRAPHATAMPVRGLGLAMYGLRPVPIAGREEARDTLWQALVRASRYERPGVVVLTGPAGCGKSRLARWLCERAHETGAAETLVATHGPTGGPTEGLAPMVARAMSSDGMPRAALYHRLTGLGLPVRLASALTEIIRPGPIASDGVPPVRLAEASQRHAWLTALVERLSRGRAVVVWLDDIQWGADALLWARALLSAQGPVLVVLTARDEALAEQPAAARALSDISAHERAASVRVDPLAGPDRAALVRGLLGLSGPLARAVEERTAGNPLFAVQLVGDWVERGVLVARQKGFVLRRGEAASLPGDLHAVWSAQLARVLEPFGDASRAAIELAATLGQAVDGEEWAAACAAAGLEPPFDALEALVEARLVLTRGALQTGWEFVHGMLRESLLRLADDAHRLTEHHRACATMLRGHGQHERRGQHLWQAGDVEPALGPLTEGAKARLDAGDAHRTLALLRQVMDGLARIEAPEAHDLRGSVRFTRIVALMAVDRVDDAMAENAALEADARRLGWPRTLVDTRLKAGERALVRGDFDGAAEALEDAARIAGTIQDSSRISNAAQIRGWLELLRGHPERVEPIVRDAFEGLHDERVMHVGNGFYLLAAACRSMGDAAGCKRWLDQARATYLGGGAGEGVARCDNVLGDLARARGDLTEAELHYRRAVEFYAPLRHADGTISELNLGLVRALDGRHEQARPLLEASGAAFVRRQQLQYGPTVELGLALCDAAAGDWDGAGVHLVAAVEQQAEVGAVDPDYADLATELAERAGAARPELASRATAWVTALASAST